MQIITNMLSIVIQYLGYSEPSVKSDLILNGLAGVLA